jgi:hypothetical protein
MMEDGFYKSAKTVALLKTRYAKRRNSRRLEFTGENKTVPLAMGDCFVGV